MMLRRLGALVLALIVTATPAVVAACEVVCAAREGHSSHADATTTRHSCHTTQPTGSAISVTSAVHVCGHGDGLPVALDKPVAKTAPASVVALVASAPRPHPGDISRRSRAATSSPPGHPHLLTPLRI